MPSLRSLCVVVYTRAGCHLCDVACDLLRMHGLVPREVDIDQNDELRNQHDTCVPVVEIKGRIRFRGRVEPLLLRRILAQSASGHPTSVPCG